jgi:hypothetical protein
MEGQAQDRIVLRLCQKITSDVGEYLKQRYKGGDYDLPWHLILQFCR